MSLNGIVSHQDWLPTFAAAAGAPDIKEKLLKGVDLNGQTYKNYIWPAAGSVDRHLS